MVRVEVDLQLLAPVPDDQLVAGVVDGFSCDGDLPCAVHRIDRVSPGPWSDGGCLLASQGGDLSGDPYVVWTGGDAPLLAGQISGNKAHIEPDLVLLGLAHVASARD